MTDGERDGAAVRFPPPLVYLIAVVAGLVLQAFVHPLRLEFPLAPRIGASAALAGVGLGLIAGAIGHFRRTGQDPAPWKSTPEIIASGVYRFTRNPMYLSMALAQASIGIGAANGWILAAIPIVLVLIQTIAIRHEEAYLERKFGETYVAYKRSVRRWI